MVTDQLAERKQQSEKQQIANLAKQQEVEVLIRHLYTLTEAHEAAIAQQQGSRHAVKKSTTGPQASAL